LNAPARCRFSHLKKRCAPVRASAERDVTTGVRCAAPAICRAACSTSANVGNRTVLGGDAMLLA
jgi:hypothetical protein